MKKLFIRTATMAIIVFLLAAMFPVYAASTVSEIRIAVGKTAIEELESDGYTVIYQNLNTEDGATEIYMGYKTGGKTITGLVVSSEKKQSLSTQKAEYTLLSEVNLNEGTNGVPVYLYYTKDENAGSGISALAFFSEKSDGTLPDFFSDGSVCVRTEDGSAADFENGIDGHGLYLFTIQNKICLPYISDIKTVGVKDGENLLKKLVSSGCDYCIEKPVCMSDGISTYICYGRTADAADAVRYVEVSCQEKTEFMSAGEFVTGGKEGTLYFSKSEDAGNPVYDITLRAFMSESFTLGDWASSYFGGKTTVSASRIFGQEDYDKLIKSEEICIELSVNYIEDGEAFSKTGLYIVTAKDGILQAEEAEDEQKEENIYETDGSFRDTEESSEKEDSDENQAVGSAIGSGSLIAIAIFLAAAVILTFVFVMTSKKKDEVK